MYTTVASADMLLSSWKRIDPYQNRVNDVIDFRLSGCRMGTVMPRVQVPSSRREILTPKFRGKPSQKWASMNITTSRQATEQRLGRVVCAMVPHAAPWSRARHVAFF